MGAQSETRDGAAETVLRYRTVLRYGGALPREAESEGGRRPDAEESG